MGGSNNFDPDLYRQFKLPISARIDFRGFFDLPRDGLERNERRSSNANLGRIGSTGGTSDPGRFEATSELVDNGETRAFPRILI